jgi:glycosyltransferase involved in cell wall biosynthesis
MNILFLNSAKEWGGNEKWTLTAASALAHRGHKVFLGCRSDLFRQKCSEVKLQFVNFAFANNADIVTLLKIRHFIKKESIDVVIPTKQREYIIGGLAARGRAKIAARMGIDRPLHNFRNRFAFCKLFDIVIVNSTRIIETLSRTKGFDPAKCRLIYNGVKIPELSQEIRTRFRHELKIDNSEVCMMCIGRLSAQKGIDYALKAFALICSVKENVRLVLVGEGSGRGEYEQLAETLNIADRVVFTGYRDDVSGLLQAADIFWLTSRSEGMANVLLEAMAHAKACVAFDIAGVAEVVKNNENGIIVPFEDIAGLKTETLQIIDNVAERNRLADNGYKTVVTGYSVEKMCADTERELVELSPP